mmetsp:Transcript_81130/g.173561  ORF Transcript_81130/g.173561 Transcript_81130/m.173561 type:complete len:377 (+) Transcript_81130:92-1222(+)
MAGSNGLSFVVVQVDTATHDSTDQDADQAGSSSVASPRDAQQEDRREAASGVVASLQSPDAAPAGARLGLERRVRRCVDSAVHCVFGPVGGVDVDAQRQARFPLRFWVFLILLVTVSHYWVVFYIIAVRPRTGQDRGSDWCNYQDKWLRGQADHLVVLFLWCIAARACFFNSHVAAHVAAWQLSPIVLCRNFLVSLFVRDGPLFIFITWCTLLWFLLMLSKTCAEWSPDLYYVLRLFAAQGGVVGTGCLLLSQWHNKLIAWVARFAATPTSLVNAAPSDTVDKLETHSFDAALFGEEEGMLYPAECVICLSQWDNTDIIKVTPCQHAFHEACIRDWLKKASTCALCRTNLVKPPSEVNDEGVENRDDQGSGRLAEL